MNKRDTSRVRIRLLIAIAVTATLLLTACGKAAEFVAEKAIEAQTGGEVDINLDGDSISFESEEGSASINIQSDEDGATVVISGTDAEGNEFSAELGGTEIPADFPMPVFEPSEVLSAVVTEAEDGTAFIIQVEIADGDADAAIAFYEDWFASEGMEIIVDTNLSSGDDVFVSRFAASDTVSAGVTVVGPAPTTITLAWTPIG